MTPDGKGRERQTPKMSLPIVWTWCYEVIKEQLIGGWRPEEVRSHASPLAGGHKLVQKCDWNPSAHRETTDTPSSARANGRFMSFLYVLTTIKLMFGGCCLCHLFMGYRLYPGAAILIVYHSTRCYQSEAGRRKGLFPSCTMGYQHPLLLYWIPGTWPRWRQHDKGL